MYGDAKRRRVVSSQTKPKLYVQLCSISFFSNSSWTKSTASLLPYEIGWHGEEKSMEAGTLLIKMDIERFTSLEILAVSES